MYSDQNFATKKALKAAVSGGAVPCHLPGPFGPFVKDGDHTAEGPHYPEAHKWYARVRVKGGCIVKVLS